VNGCNWTLHLCTVYTAKSVWEDFLAAVTVLNVARPSISPLEIWKTWPIKSKNTRRNRCKGYHSPYTFCIQALLITYQSTRLLNNDKLIMIKQIHRPGEAMYRPIQGHEWQWHPEWRQVRPKSHEWCHWHEWSCIGWYIPHPGRCISNPLENRTNRDVLHTIHDVL